MRLVLGVDGSQPSLVAHRLLLDASWPRPLEVTLVAAFERPIDWSATAAFAFLPDDEAAVRQQLGAMLAELAEPIRRMGIATETVIHCGRPATVLADVARERHADLILVGNRGRGPARAALLGSVSAALVDHAPCPVLVARGSRVERMLFATDGSETAAHAADILARWRVFPGARIDVVHVAPRAGRITDGMITPWSVSGDMQARSRAFDTTNPPVAAVQMSARLAQAGWETQPFVRHGDAASEISDAAAELGDDLIVTGSRGLGDLQRIIAGSVAHDVLLHAHASVLVMRGVVHAPAPVREFAAAPSFAP